MELYDVYVEKAMEEYFTLRDFVRRVQEGEFGRFSRAQVTDFLRRVERDILANIDIKIHADARLADQREDRIEETQRMIQELIDGYREPA